MSNLTEALPPALQDAVDKFNTWAEAHLQSEQDKGTIEDALYHYTDGRGLKGIIESGQIWFTGYRHLNDPSELFHGIDMARDVARGMANGADGRVRLFLETFADMFRQQNFEKTLEFFIASFSRERDDLGQWRAYADNGRGLAIGFSPRLFRVVNEPAEGRLPEFAGPIVYKVDEVLARHAAPLEEAARIFLETVEANADLVSDKAIGFPFMQAFARDVMASPLIWNCLTSKHPAYAHEREVRLVIMGTPEKLSPHVKTRLRGSEIVPYIAHAMPLREPHHIAEIVVGPAAPQGAERDVSTMIRSLGVEVDFPVGRSDIPYRPS
ncbi:MAG: DUF2971 domain-containing protein [Rhodomicrobium sp.]